MPVKKVGQNEISPSRIAPCVSRIIKKYREKGRKMKNKKLDL